MPSHLVEILADEYELCMNDIVPSVCRIRSASGIEMASLSEAVFTGDITKSRNFSYAGIMSQITSSLLSIAVTGRLADLENVKGDGFIGKSRKVCKRSARSIVF